VTLLVTVWARRPTSPIWSAAGCRAGPIHLPPDEAATLAARLRTLGLITTIRASGAPAPLVLL